MYLTATSLVCPVGLHASAACAAMRAGIAGFTELPYLDDHLRPVIGACVPGVRLDMKRGLRISTLLAMALEELLEKAPDLPTENIPLIVALAEPGRPGGSAGLADKIIALVQEKLKICFDSRRSSALPHGHVASFEALRVARRYLQDPAVPACIVCGVDSSINAGSLHWLQRNGRLKNLDNSNGVIPGEAAGGILLQRAPPHLHGSVCIAGLGFAMEKAHVLSDEPFLGLGLAEATRVALAEAGEAMHRMDFRLSDVTGEHYGFKEQALLLARVMRGRRVDFPIWHCSDAIGDTGAAAGICQFVRAFEAFDKGYAPGDRAISFVSNVFGERGASVLFRQA